MFNNGIELISARFAGLRGFNSPEDVKKSYRASLVDVGQEVLNNLTTPSVDTRRLHRNIVEWTFLMTHALKASQNNMELTGKVREMAQNILQSHIPSIKLALQELNTSNPSIHEALANFESAARTNSSIIPLALPPDLSLSHGYEERKIESSIKAFYDHPASSLEVLSTFSKLPKPLHWFYFLKYMPPVKLEELIKSYLKDSQRHLWMPRILLLAPKENVQKILITFSEAEKSQFKKVCAHSPDKNEEWFKSEIINWMRHFTDMAEKDSEEIDAWYDLIMEKSTKQTTSAYTFQDIRQMDQLKEKIQNQRRVFLIFRDFFETFSDSAQSSFFLDTVETQSSMDIVFQSCLNRLSHNPEAFQTSSCCPHQVMHQKTFEDRDIDDTYPAFEMLCYWGLTKVIHYIEVGLVLGAPENIIKKWGENPADVNVYVGKTVIPRLAEFVAQNCQEDIPQDKRLTIEQLKTVLLWKTLRIYNKELLTSFLKHLDNDELRNRIHYGANGHSAPASPVKKHYTNRT